MSSRTPPSSAPALPDAEQQARRHALRLHLQRMVAANYVSDAVLLALFGLAGTIPLAISIGFAAVALVITAVFIGLVASRWLDRFPTVNVNQLQLAIAAGLQLVFAVLAPPLAFFFLTNLFIVFAFGVLRLDAREAFVAWVTLAAGLALVLWRAGGQLSMPHATAFELVLVWLSYTSAFGRYVLLGVLGTRMRTKLRQRADELAASARHAEALANLDELTQCLSRRSLGRLLDERLAAARAGESFCIALFDLDHFKQVNDRYGHVVGDRVLQAFARVVQQTLRGSDALGRYGGEEFLVVLPGATQDASLMIVERIRARVAAHDWCSLAPGLSLRVSAGIAVCIDGDTVASLTERADKALYRAKDEGRDRVALAA